MAEQIRIPWRARCDCRSYRNRGIFIGGHTRDLDPSGNRNAWGIYSNGHRIATLTEAELWLSQSQVDAHAELIPRAVNNHDALLAALVALFDCSVRQDPSAAVMLAARDAIAAATK